MENKNLTTNQKISIESNRIQKGILWVFFITLLFSIFGWLYNLTKEVGTLKTQILEVQNQASIGGDLIVGRNATVTGAFVVGQDTGHITPGCIGIMTSEGQWVFGSIDSASKLIDQGLTWSVDKCSSPDSITFFIGSRP